MLCCIHRLIAVGIRPYFKSNWNCFDAFITALSVMGVLIGGCFSGSGHCSVWMPAWMLCMNEGAQFE